MFGGKSESELAAQERIRAQLPIKDGKGAVKGNARPGQEMEVVEEDSDEDKNTDFNNE
jgi:hypothetical protein